MIIIFRILKHVTNLLVAVSSRNPYDLPSMMEREPRERGREEKREKGREGERERGRTTCHYCINRR